MKIALAVRLIIYGTLDLSMDHMYPSHPIARGIPWSGSIYHVFSSLTVRLKNADVLDLEKIKQFS